MQITGLNWTAVMNILTKSYQHPTPTYNKIHWRRRRRRRRRLWRHQGIRYKFHVLLCPTLMPVSDNVHSLPAFTPQLQTHCPYVIGVILQRRWKAGCHVTSTKTGNVRINVTLKCVRVTPVAVEKQHYIFWVWACSLSYPARKAHATIILQFMVCPALPYFSTLSHKRYDFRKKKSISYSHHILIKSEFLDNFRKILKYKMS
jgi:hypothetical protein